MWQSETELKSEATALQTWIILHTAEQPGTTMLQVPLLFLFLPTFPLGLLYSLCVNLESPHVCCSYGSSVTV